MNEATPIQLWMRRSAVALVCAILLIFRIVPFEFTATRLPPPDTIYCVIMFLVIRRPEYVPIWVLFLVFLLRDILASAPLGLLSMLLIIGTELVRANIQAFREYNFVLEWAWISGVYVTALLAQQVILWVTLSDVPPFSGVLLLAGFTTALYPVVSVILRFLCGIDRPNPGETDAWGKRL